MAVSASPPGGALAAAAAFAECAAAGSWRGIPVYSAGLHSIRSTGMRGLFGLVGLVVVLGIVGIVAKKQL
ncbi:MAG: hypothetical protein EON49_26210, partial [Acidovorax sp.]